MIGALDPGPVGMAAVEAIAAIAGRSLGGAHVSAYVEVDPIPWSAFSDGGWDTVGLAEADGGGGASLTDLVVIARAWGEWLVPLPFLETVMARRWSPAARGWDGPVTVSVSAIRYPGYGLVPFGTRPGMAVASSLGSEEGQVVPMADGESDGFAASLRLARTGWTTSLSPLARAEMAAVWAAEATGSAARVLDLAVDYAKERQQFGLPIGSFQAIKHRLADMKVLAEAAETAVLWASVDLENSVRAAELALDHSARIIEQGIHVHGGMGFTWEAGLHYYLRHVAALRDLVRGVGS